MILGFSTDYGIDYKQSEQPSANSKLVTQSRNVLVTHLRKGALDFYVYYSCIVIAASADNPISRKKSSTVSQSFSAYVLLRLKLEHSLNPMWTL